MHAIDGTMLVFLATILVAFERIGLAVMVGGIGVWVVARCMREQDQGSKPESEMGPSRKMSLLS